jgi:hypothetical protein
VDELVGETIGKAFFDYEDKHDQANIGHYFVRFIPGLYGLIRTFGGGIDGTFLGDLTYLSGDGKERKKSKKDSKGWIEELQEEE